MTDPPTTRVPRHEIVRALIGITVFFAATQAAVVVFIYGLDRPYLKGLIRFLDATVEANLPTVFSGFLLLLAASCLWLICRAPQAQIERSSWRLLCIVFFVLTVDELAKVHEMFDSDTLLWFIQLDGYFAWPWVIVYGVLVVAVATRLLGFLVRLEPLYRNRFMIAGALYVGAALGLELIEARDLGTRDVDLGYHLVASIEEILEMVAIVVFIDTLLLWLENHGVSHRFRFER